jgi:hypothetical protein
VDELGLTEGEFRRVLTACRLLHIGDCTPAYLQEFLARRLEEASDAPLAARLRRFSTGRMDALCERIKQEQDRRP